jgi:hypothetical protein
VNDRRVKYYKSDRGQDLRKTDPSARKTWVVNELWELHHEVIRLLLLGFKNKDIAQTMGISAVQVSNIRNSPVVQRRLAELHDIRDAEAFDARKEIDAALPESFQLLRSIIRGTDEGRDASINLRARTAENMIDRAVPKKTQHEHVHGHLTAEDIKEIKRRAEDNSDQLSASV